MWECLESLLGSYSQAGWKVWSSAIGSVLNDILCAGLGEYSQSGWECHLVPLEPSLRACLGVYLKVSCELTWERTVKQVCIVSSSAIVRILESVLRGVLESVLRAYLRAYSQVGWEVSSSTIGSVLESVLRSMIDSILRDNFISRM